MTTPRALAPVVAAVASTGVGWTLASAPRLGLLVAGGVVAAGAVLFAVARPGAVFAVAVVALVFIPVYAVPSIGPALLHPGLVLLWLLAATLVIARLAARRTSSLTVIDFAVALVVVAFALAVLFETRELTAFLYTLTGWLGPYLGARLAVGDEVSPERLAKVFVVAAVALTPFVLYETATQSNLFLSFGGGEGVWLDQIDRLARTRAEASFGHPIALAMFLSTAALLAAGLALNARGRRSAMVWGSLGGLVFVIQGLAVSRSGLLVAFVGLAVLLVRHFARVVNPKTVAFFLAAGAAVAFVPQAEAVRETVLSFFVDDSSSEIATSGQYRIDLLARVGEPGLLQPFGVTEHYLGSIDNAYLDVALNWGVVAAAALAVLAVVVLGAVASWREGDVAFMVVNAALANMVALAVVAFITQQQLYIWLLLGASSAVLAQRAGRREPAAIRAERRIPLGGPA